MGQKMGKSVIFLLALALAGCATKYQDLGFSGGVAAQPITHDTYRIVARDNGYTAGTTVQDFVLLKAAETAKASGNSHFAIVSGSDATTSAVGQTAGYAQTNFIGGTDFTTYSPGISYNIIKPGQDGYIRVSTPKKGEPLPVGAFAADVIIANVGLQVKRPSS